MEVKDEAKDEAKGSSSLSREDLLKYIKRLKAKVKGLEEEKAQSERESGYLKKGYDSQKQAWDDLYERVRLCAEAANGGAPADSLDPTQLCAVIQSALGQSRPADVARVQSLEQQNEELRLKCDAAVAVQLDLSTQLQQMSEEMHHIVHQQKQQQEQEQELDVHGKMEALVLELQRLDKWALGQQYMMQLRAVVNEDEVPPTVEHRKEREQHQAELQKLGAEMQKLETELGQAREVAEKRKHEQATVQQQLSSMEAELLQLREAATISTTEQPNAVHPPELEPLPAPLPSDLPTLIRLLNDEVSALRLSDASRFQALLEQVSASSSEQQLQLQRIDSVASMEGGDVLRRNASTDSLIASPSKAREGGDEKQELALKLKRLVVKCKKLQEEVAAASASAADAAQLVAERDQEIDSLKAAMVELQERQQSLVMPSGEAAAEVTTDHQQEMSSLRTEMEQLVAEIARLRGEASNSESEAEALRKQVVQLQEIVSSHGDALKAVTEDADATRQLLHEREQEIAHLTTSLAAATSEHEQGIQDSANQHATMQQEWSAVREELQNQIVTLQAQNSQLGESNKTHLDKIADLSASTEALRTTLHSREEELQQSSKRAQLLEEKAKKLKMLLSKAHNASQERESELTNLRQAAAAPSHMLAELSVQHEDCVWFLLMPTDEKGQALQDAQSMWQSQATLERWQSQGTQLHGVLPETVQAKAMTEIEQAREREQTLDAELATLRSNFAELEQSFEAYKSRAQAALKRMTREDSNLRRDQHEAEHAKLLSLSEQVEQLNRETESKTGIIEAQDEELGQLREQVTHLRSNMSESEAARTALTSRVRDLSDQEVVLTEKLSDLEGRNAELLAQVKSLSACLREKEAELRVAMTQAVPIAPEVVHAPAPVELKTEKSLQESVPKPSEEQQQVPAASSHADQHDSPSLPSMLGAAGSNENLLLLDQARQDKEEVQDMMKLSVQQLTAELVEVREQLLQLHEQNDVLRESIRELDGQLCRERELNSHDRRLNAEYLTNVVRSFLVCDDKDERLRLIPVICHILHFNSSEQQEILAKWSGSRGGIAGWTSTLWGAKPKSDDGPKPPHPKLDPTTLAGFELQI